MKTENVYIEFLVLQIQAGDVDAWSKLLPVIRQKMFAYAKRLLNGAADTEDCVQEAMMVVVKRVGQLREVKAFHGWLYRIIHSRCMDYLRKLPSKEDEINSGMELNKLCSDDNHTRSATDSKFDVNKAINRLNKIQQSVVYLFYFEGFAVVEISVILDKPAGTIKSHLFDARTAIKSFLDQEKTHEY